MYNLMQALIDEKINFSLFTKQIIEEISEQRLKKLLRHVLTHSPFYKSYYLNVGVTLKHINEVTIKDLPFVSKSLLMENFDSIICDQDITHKSIQQYFSNGFNYKEWYKNTYKVLKTSGTTGKPGVFIYSKRDCDTLKSVLINRATKIKPSIGKKIKIASIFDTDDFHAGISMSGTAPELFYKIFPIAINQPISNTIKMLNDIQPDILGGYASGVYMVAIEQLKGNLKIRPLEITCTGELLTNSMRTTIFKAFGKFPTNVYAASESLCIGQSCENGNIHINEDWHIIESPKDLKYIDDNYLNEQCFYLTNLFNYTFPLIRYKMEDRVELSSENCSCGSPFHHLNLLEGRTEDVLTFETNGSSEILFHSIIVKLLIPGIERFQIVQYDMNKLLVNVCVNNKVNKNDIYQKVNDEMNEILTFKGLKNFVTFSIQFSDFISNDVRTGKFRYIIPYQKYITTKKEHAILV